MKLRKLVTMREALESDGYFSGMLAGDSWGAWRTLLVAIAGEELTDEEREAFKSLTGRDREPLGPVLPGTGKPKHLLLEIILLRHSFLLLMGAVEH